MFSIIYREIKSLFLSPLAWIILAIIQFILAYTFIINIERFIEIQAQLVGLVDAPGFTEIIGSSLLSTASIIFMLIVPLLTMRLISGERQAKTLSLLLSAPISTNAIILGKFFGLLSFHLIMLLMISLMPLSLIVGGNLDLWQLFAGFLGLALLLAAQTAIGLYISTLTAHPTIAAIGTFGILLSLWIIDWTIGSNNPNEILIYLSMTKHYEALLVGIFNTQDVVYYLLIIVLFLTLAIKRLNNEVLNG
jgi:ABC-2 type transport system permease protein